MSVKLTDWQAKQRLSAAHLQEAWTMLRRVASVMGWDVDTEGDESVHVPDSWNLGRISGAGPAGEGDYTDARYWVREVYILSGADPDAAIVFEDYDPWDAGDVETNGLVPVIHTVTNLSELIDNTHNLPIDTPVLYKTLFDVKDDTITDGQSHTRNVMVVGGSVGAGEFIGMEYDTVAQNTAGWIFATLHAEKV